MQKIRILFLLITITFFSFSQSNPAITTWLQNTTVTGRHYISGNPTAISDPLLKVNTQEISYSAASVYVKTMGIPAYIVGPFTGDGNPNQAGDQNAIFKFPLSPTQNTGTLTATSGGNIGVFINGVAMFDFRDGVAWNNTAMALCGGPGRTACPGGPMTVQAWNRDAIIAEKAGFDCAKGHPAGTNYHHHQNPSAFDLDLNVISSICSIYDADGLYIINPAQHSPLIGFAYDGFPVYGAYGYANVDGTGGITRMKSGFQLKVINPRTNGPTLTMYAAGYFREDYEWIAHAGDESYLDIHNGRFTKTPEYPNGTYAYFATVDANYNSAYPYLIGPTYYGNKTAAKVTSITEPVTIYTVNNPLPVKLLNFKGYLNENKAHLSWETASESNSNYFNIQRSLNGISFENIGKVQAAKSSNENIKYSFIDENAPIGVLYYRLEEIDLSGKNEVFKSISLVNKSDGNSFKVFPNPSNDLISIQTSGLLKQDVEIDLIDLSGKLIQKTRLIAGQTVSFFNVETLYAGNYLVNIKKGDICESHKVLIRK
jgi:YHYH protein/Secretion system C-terminal sorting domain